MKDVPELRLHAKKTRFVLVGTKSDLRGSGAEEVTEDDCWSPAKDIHAAKYCECSSGVFKKCWIVH